MKNPDAKKLRSKERTTKKASKWSVEKSGNSYEWQRFDLKGELLSKVFRLSNGGISYSIQIFNPKTGELVIDKSTGKIRKNEDFDSLHDALRNADDELFKHFRIIPAWGEFMANFYLQHDEGVEGDLYSELGYADQQKVNDLRSKISKYLTDFLDERKKNNKKISPNEIYLISRAGNPTAICRQTEFDLYVENSDFGGWIYLSNFDQDFYRT
ncbi:hypothetical protein GF340_01855 [Candidatus Peregrinibacteria bacterium]|nr:hypothetical protein [Candidatus Peregrinibacteria bacterium]